MSLVLTTVPGYWFGAKEPPKIPGFRVTAREGEWMQARRGNLNYMVRETPTHWIMERYARDNWGRNAERYRKARHRQRIATRSREETGGYYGHSIKMPPYTGEHLKGRFSCDPTEAIAVRKTEVSK